MSELYAANQKNGHQKAELTINRKVLEDIQKELKDVETQKSKLLSETSLLGFRLASNSHNFKYFKATTYTKLNIFKAQGTSKALNCNLILLRSPL